MGDLDAATLARIGPDEQIVDHVFGVGAVLIVTRLMVIVIREGAQFRPRSGVRSWSFGTLHDVQISPPKHGSGRVVIRVGGFPWQSVSLFISAAEWAAAERVVGKIRVLEAQFRRSQQLGNSSDPSAPNADPPDTDR
jgi:hypothetical protein